MLKKIANSYPELSNSEKVIADYFIKNRGEVISSNIHELAKKIGTSSASLSRFVKKINDSTFAQAKVSLAMSFDGDSLKDASEVISFANDFRQLPSLLLNTISEYCEQTIGINSLEKFSEVIDLIIASDTIYIYGVGTSGLMAIDLQHKLIKLKKKCIYNFDSNFGIMGSRLTTAKDLVIAFSYSGRSKEVLIPVQKARENGAKIISFTSIGNNSLAKISDHKFFVPNNEIEENRISSIFQRYETLYMIDVLFIGLAKRMLEKEDVPVNDYRELVGLLKERG